MSESNNLHNENSNPQNNEKYSKIKNELDQTKNDLPQVKEKIDLESRKKRPLGIYIMSPLLVIAGLWILGFTLPLLPESRTVAVVESVNIGLVVYSFPIIIGYGIFFLSKTILRNIILRKNKKLTRKHYGFLIVISIVGSIAIPALFLLSGTSSFHY